MNQIQQHEFVNEADGTVVVDRVIRSEYGPKAVLGGDTYDAKESIKSLDWNATHRSWDGDIEAWTIDDDALDDLERQLESDGFSFGGVARDALQWMFDELPDDPIGHTDAPEIEVEYESAESDSIMTKSGKLTGSFDEAKSEITFRRDDGTMMVITGDELKTPASHYPHVGTVRKIILELPREAMDI